MFPSKAPCNGGCAWSAGCRVYAFNALDPLVVGTEYITPNRLLQQCTASSWGQHRTSSSQDGTNLPRSSPRLVCQLGPTQLSGRRPFICFDDLSLWKVLCQCKFHSLSSCPPGTLQPTSSSLDPCGSSPLVGHSADSTTPIHSSSNTHSNRGCCFLATNWCCSFLSFFSSWRPLWACSRTYLVLLAVIVLPFNASSNTPMILQPSQTRL